MSGRQAGSDRARAAAYLGRINLEIIKAAGARLQGHGAEGGARLPAALAGGPVRLAALSEPAPDGTRRHVTPLGYLTARRSLPRALSKLTPDDPRRRAALILADTVERIGAVKGADLSGDGATVTKGGASDGGATTRVACAARLALIEAAANGWPVTRTGRVLRGAPRLALGVGRQTGAIKEIRAFDALVQLCVEAVPLDEQLRRAGWKPETRTRRKLEAALLVVLDDVAGALGMGRWMARDP